MKTRWVALALAVAVAPIGCVSSRPPAGGGLAWEFHGPFALRLPKTVAWTTGRPHGYDPQLPGYHLTGDIGSFKIVPHASPLPEKLVLAIKTGGDAPPRLDHFRLTVRGGHLETEPFNPDSPTRVTWTNRAENTFMYAEKGTYFEFEAGADAVLVTFKPAVMELLQGVCIVSWIDRYR